MTYVYKLIYMFTVSIEYFRWFFFREDGFQDPEMNIDSTGSHRSDDYSVCLVDSILT